jgi:hypothetical protein
MRLSNWKSPRPPREANHRRMCGRAKLEAFSDFSGYAVMTHEERVVPLVYDLEAYGAEHHEGESGHVDRRPE